MVEDRGDQARRLRNALDLLLRYTGHRAKHELLTNPADAGLAESRGAYPGSRIALTEAGRRVVK